MSGFFSALGVGWVLWVRNSHCSFWLEAGDGKDGKRRQPRSVSPDEHHFLHRYVFFWDESLSIADHQKALGLLETRVNAPYLEGVHSSL